MFSSNAKFVGRQEEVQDLVGLVDVSGATQIAFVIGSGGVGKTWLLHELHRICADQSAVNVFPLIDFDDTANRLALQVIDIIAKAKPEAFHEYFVQHADYRAIIDAGVSQTRAKEEESRLLRAFLSCYNSISKDRRVVLLFDTIEVVTQLDIWDDLAQLFKGMGNTVIVLAGRECGPAREILGKDDHSNLKHIALRPFTREDSYLFLKNELKYVDNDLAENLFVLTSGQPILLALAAEWLNRDHPLLEIATSTAHDFDAPVHRGARITVAEIRRISSDSAP